MFFLNLLLGKNLFNHVILIFKIEAGHAPAIVLHPATSIHPTGICNLPGSYCEWYHFRELYFL